MSFSRLDERSDNVVLAKKASGTQVSATGATTATITNLSLAVPAKPPPGYTIRITLAGTKTGTNAAHTLNFYLNGTLVLTITAGAATAVEWMAQAVITCVGRAVQDCMGMICGQGIVGGAVHNAATVDCSEGAALTAVIGLNASDTVTVEMFTIETFVADIL